MRMEAHSFVYCFTSILSQRSRQKYRQMVENTSCSAEWWQHNDSDEGLAYPSFRLSPTGAGLTDILGWVEMELCDWLLVKDDVSRLTGDIGGVRLLHSECEREPEVAEEKGMNSDCCECSLSDDVAAKLNCTSVRSSGARITNWSDLNAFCPKL